jgi:hypothetical protein
LETYYQPGSTTRNKCWLLKGFLGFLRLRRKNSSPEQLTQIIICKKLFNQAGNRNKQAARADRVLLEEEYYMAKVSSMSSPHIHLLPLFLSSVAIFFCLSIPIPCKLYIFLFVSSSCTC